MRWFEKEIDNITAHEFIDECHSFTEEFILNYAKEMIATWPLTNILPSSIFKFKPKGAIIHTSNTMSLWNELHLCTKHIFGTHFVITSSNHDPNISKYPLLAELPANILMMYPIDALVPHSGYISPFTWGIELRNAGLLRPSHKGMKPTPILPSEETERNFRVTPNIEYDAFWRNKLWCYPFNGSIIQWEDYIYELPFVNQIVSLIALLRALDQLSGGLDRRLVLPSNCISGSEKCLPYIVWDKLRTVISERNAIEVSHEYLNYFTVATNTRLSKLDEMCDIEDEDESLHGEQLELFRWRGERDDGQLAALKAQREFNFSSLYRSHLESIGYDKSDTDLALQLWAISQGLTIAKDDEIQSRIHQMFYGIRNLI